MKTPSQHGFSLPEMLATLSILMVLVGIVSSAADVRLDAVQNLSTQNTENEQKNNVRPSDLRIPMWRAEELRRQHKSGNKESTP